MKTTTNPNLSKTTETFKNITKILIDRGISISTMESCTAGLVATMLTNEPGASAIMKYIELMNEQITFYPPIESFIMNATEHGCYILYRK